MAEMENDKTLFYMCSDALRISQAESSFWYQLSVLDRPWDKVGSFESQNQ